MGITTNVRKQRKNDTSEGPHSAVHRIPNRAASPTQPDRIAVELVILDGCINDLDHVIKLLLDESPMATAPGPLRARETGLVKAAVLLRGIQNVLEAHMRKAEGGAR